MREWKKLAIQGIERCVLDQNCLPSITEPLQVALENGAIRAVVPISNKAQFAALPEETEKVDVIFYGDVDRAVLKAMEI